MATTTADLKLTIESINKQAALAIAAATKYLKSKNKFATGRLIRSLQYRVKKLQDGASVYFEFEDYGHYVNAGRKPNSKQPPLKPIKKWCRVKGIPEAMAFSIARSIGKKGIKATPFLRFFQNDFVKYGEQSIANALAKDIDKIIAKELKDIKIEIKS